MSTAEIGKDFVEHKVFKAKERESLAEKGQAMPGGGFPIRNQQDLKNAIMAFGRAKNKAAAKAWIIKRAKELELEYLLPEDWVEHTNAWTNFLQHHGVKGMRWGVRRSRRQLRRAAEKGGKGRSIKDLDDKQLQQLVNRMNMEQQYSRLSGGSRSSGAGKYVAAGGAFASGIALNVARSQITSAANRRIGSAIATRAARESAVRGLKRLG
jgi:hypothetical protein